jgi:tRNA (guanine-N7-)-methyltransferase
MVRETPDALLPHELDPAALPRDEEGPVRWKDVFGADLPLRIEVGVGNSTFLIEVARRSPRFNYLGFEYSRKRVVKFLTKLEAAEIGNVRMLCINIDSLLDTAFAPGSVEHFYINHPDPWPKRRHARRRFVREEKTATLVNLLREGGGISLRTDSPPYARQMLRVLDAAEGLENLHGAGQFAPRPVEEFATPYEKKFMLQGLRIHYLEFRKTGSRDPVPRSPGREGLSGGPV